MPSVAEPSWLRRALIGVGLITLARVVLLWFNKTDLFVDEAQYWLWGQELAFGYYSKPPLIGWVIRLSTEIGSNAEFWVRLPAPLFHAATALVLGAIAARLFDARAGVVVALGYVTLPMVAVGSLLISTDTIMFPFLAASLLFYLRMVQTPRVGLAVLCGLFLGLAFMAKYAAVYFVICAVIAAPFFRPKLEMVLVALGAFLVTISPNLMWNMLNGLTTLQHTMDNADWVRDPAARAGLNWDHLAEFFGAQFAVFGPVLMAALLILVARWARRSGTERLLLIFSLPIIAIVCAQALLNQAY
ncbi:MAG: glycosyltransferase family 39 protein, partial [Pseudomonadota bacterium]